MRNLILVSCVIVAAAAAYAGPIAVSPSSSDGVALVESRCPTFSWTSVPNRDGYELVVSRTPEGSLIAVPLSSDEAVIWTRIPGAANSWTPNLDGCLEPGNTYTWWIRPLGGERADDWSEPSTFQVAARGDEATSIPTSDGLRLRGAGGNVTHSAEGETVGAGGGSPMSLGDGTTAISAAVVDGFTVSSSGDIMCTDCIHAGEVAPITAIAVECNGECGDSNLGQVCDRNAAGGEPIAVSCTTVTSWASTHNCGGDNVCANVTNSLLRSSDLARFCADGRGYDAYVYCLRP